MRGTITALSLLAAFGAGYAASRAGSAAQAQPAAAITTRIFELAAMKDEEIGPIVPNTELRTRNLIVTEWGTVGIQVGNVFKHYHADANEVQYIIEGTGSFWLGDKEVQIKPGDLISIPKGTHHAGSKPATGRFKALAIKMPPQRPDDTKRVD